MAKLMMMMVVVLASLIAVVAAGEDDAPVLSLKEAAQEASEPGVIEEQDEALAPEPAGDDVLAADRGLLGGRVGYDFSPPGSGGGLVVEDRHDDRRRLRNLLDDDVVLDMAPAPEFELAVDRSYLSEDPAALSDPTIRDGTYLPEIANSERLREENRIP